MPELHNQLTIHRGSNYIATLDFLLCCFAADGGSNDGANPKRCAEMTAWAENQLLPSMKTIVTERNACAAAHCGGHGRCVDYDSKATRTCACMGGWKGPACGTKL